MDLLRLWKMIIVGVLLVAYSNNSCSQNLVVNGNFDLYFRCPQSYNQYNNNIKDLIPGWGTVNKSTPDFFHRCSQNTDVGVPQNFAGIIEPVDGDGYMGIILRVDEETYPFSSSYSEHITGVLETPLERGKSYCFSFYYALAQNSGIVTNTIGIYFSKDKPVFQDYDEQYGFQPQLILHNDSVLGSRPGWNILSAVYVASGGEKFFTIGNFQPLSQSTAMKRMPEVYNDTRFFAYYYIDDVRMFLVEDGPCFEEGALVLSAVRIPNYTDTIQENDNDKFRIGSIYTLKNLHFDFEKTEIRIEDRGELDELILFLKENSNIHIKIIGHTDAVGNDAYNQLLSESRAKAVMEYLYAEGIALTRMAYIGKGSSQPVSDNETEHGRQLNRRVEIEFFVP